MSDPTTPGSLGRRAALGTVAAAAAGLSAPGVLRAQGQQYPTRPVTMVVGFPPGGQTDFAARIDPHIVSRKVLECLGAAGAFDSLDPDRARIHANIPRIFAAAQERLAGLPEGPERAALLAEIARLQMRQSIAEEARRRFMRD